MKARIVSLCGGKTCCPFVEIGHKTVKIGEKGNFCILKKEEWEILREKIRSGDL